MMLEKKHKCVTQLKLEANERFRNDVSKFCDCLKIRYPERSDKINIYVLKKYFEEGRETAWLFQFIPDYFSCLPLTASLSVISLLSSAARPSFLSRFYTACKRTSIFVLLSVLPPVLFLLHCCFFISSIFSFVTSGYSACICRAIRAGEPR
jgi:hypothetical protein